MLILYAQMKYLVARPKEEEKKLTNELIPMKKHLTVLQMSSPVSGSILRAKSHPYAGLYPNTSADLRFSWRIEFYGRRP